MDDWEATSGEIREVAEKFVIANCYDPKVAAQFFNDSWMEDERLVDLVAM